MKINEITIIEKKRRRRKSRGAAYGPGPYGVYGYLAGYSGDSGSEGAAESIIDKISPSTLWEEQEEDIRQELLKNPRLFKNTKDFTDLRTFLDQFGSNDIKVGNSYVYSSVASMTPGRIMSLAYFGNAHRLVGIKNNQVFFDINGKIQSYPESGDVEGDLLKQVLLFPTVEDFSKFQMLLKLKFSEWIVKTKILDKSVAEGIKLKFHTIELAESQIKAYAKEYFKCYNIEQPHGKFVSNIKRLGSSKLTESSEANEIAPFIQLINSVDTVETIKIGDYFSVLSFEINFAWKEIDASGFTTPKEVVDIKMHQNGTINYIKFADGDRYPRLTPATYQSKPIIQTAYFDRAGAASAALTALVLKVPDGWDFNTTNVEQGVAENFADGKKPGRKGLAKRMGVNCKQSVSKLRSIAAKSSGEKQRMAHWCANMKSGKRK